MDETQQRLFQARKERFFAKANSGSFATRLCSAGVTNEGPDHESATMIARSRRAVGRIMSDIFDASLQLGRR